MPVQQNHHLPARIIVEHELGEPDVAVVQQGNLDMYAARIHSRAA
jgi:hypothetical protein